MNPEQLIDRAHPMGDRHQPQPGATAAGNLGEPIIATVTKQGSLMVWVGSHLLAFLVRMLSQISRMALT